MDNKNELLFRIASWISISSYRKRVMVALGGKLKTPSTLARESGIATNHISKTLRELKDKDLIICINEDAKKGRLYQMTELGSEVMQKLKMID